MSSALADLPQAWEDTQKEADREKGIRTFNLRKVRRRCCCCSLSAQ